MCDKLLAILRSVFYLCLFASIALSACSLDFEPARTKASIMVALPGLSATAPQSAANDRAVASGSGFLYLQTELAEQSAEVFGPYPVSPGDVIIVADIPVGTYSAIAVLFLPSLPENPLTPIIPVASTLDDFRLATVAALESSPEVSSATSVGLVENFQVMAGEQNVLNARLVPATTLTHDSEGSIVLSGTTGVTTRRFIRLPGLVSRFVSARENDQKTLNMTLSHEGADPVSITGIGLYTSIGLAVLREYPDINLEAGTPLSRSIAWDGDEVYYAYVEFSGPELACLFETRITKQLMISYNANGGTGTVASQLVEEGSLTTLAVGGFTRDGYSFMGWSTNADAPAPEYAAGATFTAGSSDVTFYAIWQANETIRTVRFSANGGVGSITDFSGPVGSSFTLPSSGFTRDGYTFQGWAISSTATSYDYAPSTIFTIGSSDTLLYAVWIDIAGPTIISASFPTDFSNTSMNLSISLAVNELGSGIKTITLSGDFASYSTTTVQVGASNVDVTVSMGTITLTNPVTTTETITINGINLTTGDGMKSVQIELFDAVGNVSNSFNDSIMVDTIAPTLDVTLTSPATYSLGATVLVDGATLYTTSTGELVISVSDTGGSGATGLTAAGWNVAASPAIYQTEGASWISVQDNAGNSTIINFTTVLDEMPPEFGTPQNPQADSFDMSVSDAGSGINPSDFQAQYSDEYSVQQANPSAITTWYTATYNGSNVAGLISDTTTNRYRYIRVLASDNVGNMIERYVERYNSGTLTLLP